MKNRWPLAIAGAISLVGTAVAEPPPGSRSGPWSDVITTAAQPSRLAASTVLLAVARAGRRVVAVGERGHILYSDDNAAAWRQAAVPTSVTLTAVRFATPQVGWAVGHLGTVLKTTDGGQTWVRQLDGAEAARLVLSAAEASGDRKRIAKAKLWSEDGPDKPFLAVVAIDDTKVLAVGAYGLAVRTENGGASWSAIDDRLENPASLHLNAAAVIGKRVLLAGEQGLLLRSDDGGRSFQALPSPYDGSLFDVFGRHDELLVIGLRGNAFRSQDGGATWTPCPRASDETLSTGMTLADGHHLLGTAGGRVLLASPSCQAVFPVDALTGLGPLAGAVITDNGKLIMVGATGATAANLPSRESLQ